MACVILLAQMALGLALAAGGGIKDPHVWDGETYRPYEDAAAEVAFPVPLTQSLVDARHFQTGDPAQMTDVLTLFGPEGEEVEVGIWQNREALALGDWIAKYEPFLLTPDRAQFLWHASHGRLDAQMFEYPRTGQQYARRTAIFASGGRVFRVTCMNRDDARAEAVFESVLEGIEAQR